MKELLLGGVFTSEVLLHIHSVECLGRVEKVPLKLGNILPPCPLLLPPSTGRSSVLRQTFAPRHPHTAFLHVGKAGLKLPLSWCGQTKLVWPNHLFHQHCWLHALDCFLKSVRCYMRQFGLIWTQSWFGRTTLVLPNQLFLSLHWILVCCLPTSNNLYTTRGTLLV